MKKKIFCIGGANLDYKLKTLTPLVLNTSNPVTSILAYGGVARNVAENLAYLTHNIALQTVVGNDIEGQQLLTHLKTLNVDCNASLILPNQRTSHYYAILNDQGDMHIALSDMQIYQHLPYDQLMESWQALLSETIVFLDTNLPFELINQIINLAKVRQFCLCIDPVSVQKTQSLPDKLGGVFLIKPNQLEASALTNMTINTIDDCMNAGLSLLNRGVQNVIVTLGAKGYVIVNNHIKEHLPAFHAPAITDVNGAGDAFFAGVLYGLQTGMAIPQACRIGAKLAALTVQSTASVINHSFKQVLVNEQELPFN